MRMFKNKTAAVVAVAAVVAGTAGTAAATGAADRGSARVSRTTITVCVGAKREHLRLVSPTTTRCGTGERLLSWKTAGTPGVQGKRGLAGKAGKNGLAGRDGSHGDSAYEARRGLRLRRH